MTIQIGSYENTIKAEAKARRIRLMGITKPVNYKPESLVVPPGKSENLCYIVLQTIKTLGGKYTLDDVLSDSREQKLTELRQKCYFEVAKRRPDLDTPRIARFFNRGHSSIKHGIRSLKITGWSGVEW